MKIKQLRVDSRLIHGQVATFWTNFLGINRIIVVSDEIVKDKLQVDMLKMSCPSGCKLTVCQISTLVRNLANVKYQGDEILIIAPNVDTVYKLYHSLEDKDMFPPLNLGNIPKRDQTVDIARTVNITVDEKEKLDDLLENGINIFLQMIPNNSAVDYKDAIELIGKENYES